MYNGFVPTRGINAEGAFPHHAAIAFDHAGKAIFDAIKLLGVDNIATPLPAGTPYPGENVF